jgi:UMF1 family MFS transporter
MLLAFLVYNDGIGTIIRMATIYGTELGLPAGALIGAILLVQFIGIPAAIAFGAIAGRVGAKPAILAGLLVYTGVAILAYFTRTVAHFFALAVLVGLVQGGTQALSRSLFASLIPRRLSGEFFGFFAVSEKVAGILGPGLFALAIAVTGSSRSAVLSVIAFFAVGAALLWRVDVAEGRRAAEAADAAAAAPRGPGDEAAGA